MFKFDLGDQVIDVFTNFKGIIESRIQHLNGCIQYMVQPKVDKDGKMPDGFQIDEQNLKLIKKSILKQKEEKDLKLIRKLKTKERKIKRTPPGGARVRISHNS